MPRRGTGLAVQPAMPRTPRYVWSATAVAILLFAFVSARARGATISYRVEPADSRVMVAVGKAGAFSFIAGHAHQVEGAIEAGTVDVDPDDPSRARIRVVLATSMLKVSDAGEPPDDLPKVQQTMDGEKVLDVAHYPRITFESTSTAITSRSSGVLDALVAGQLTIRGVSSPVTAPVRVELGEHVLKAEGRVDVKQSAFGIRPVSVGGLVAVKDTLAVTFAITARR